MAFPTHKAFSFRSQAVAEDTFYVVQFSGNEGLSNLYRFEIVLSSHETTLDTMAIVQAPACFVLERAAGKLPFHGVLERFEQLHHAHGLTFFRAVLSPKFCWLTLTHHNQIFLQKTCPEFLSAVLQDGGLHNGVDFELRLRETYPAWEYVCQYGESHFAFVSRWMERYGMYYFFEQNEEREKLIITDSRAAHKPMPQGDVLRYAPASGLETPYAEEIVTSYNIVEQMVPRTVLLKDYNYRTPGLSLEARAEVSPQGEGEVYIYGEHFRTPDEGRSLAAIRAQELACRATLYQGISSVPFVRSGYTFSLRHHFIDQANQQYCTISVHHEGSQKQYLEAGLNVKSKQNHSDLFYRNSFTAIPSAVQFRPERLTPSPHFHGVMPATIDTAAGGQYAELDEQGRYKVILPFDLSGRKNGKASSWLRMMQPYGGSDHGMHLPLHKGAEVLLACIDGNPDRPFIYAAVPNTTHPSLVKDSNQSKCMLTTAGQNRLHMENMKGSERILLTTPTEGTFVRLGAPNDPDSGKWEKDEEREGFKLKTNKAFEVFAGTENEVVMIESSCWVGGGFERLASIFSTEINMVDYFQWLDPWDKNWAPLMSYLHGKIQAAVGVDEELNETQLEIASDLLKMRQMHQKLTETYTSLQESNTKLDQDRTKIEDESVKLLRKNQRILQAKNHIAQTKTQMIREKTQLHQEIISALETHTSISETRNTLQTQKTQLIQARTQLIENKTKIGATLETITEDFNTLTNLSLKL